MYNGLQNWVLRNSLDRKSPITVNTKTKLEIILPDQFIV
jgi:hypothetical protein